MKKSDFVLSLQDKPQPLHPHQISQEIRLRIGYVCTNKIDLEMKTELIRGYFAKGPDKLNRTPENPELFECVVGGDQSKAWQMLVWTKEILHILDDETHRTDNEDRLASVLDNRRVIWVPNDQTPLNVVADVNGFIFAIACMVPRIYRNVLRNQHRQGQLDFEQLEEYLLIPSEYIPHIIDASFEEKLMDAISQG